MWITIDMFQAIFSWIRSWLGVEFHHWRTCQPSKVQTSILITQSWSETIWNYVEHHRWHFHKLAFYQNALNYLHNVLIYFWVINISLTLSHIILIHVSAWLYMTESRQGTELSFQYHSYDRKCLCTNSFSFPDKFQWSIPKFQTIDSPLDWTNIWLKIWCIVGS